MATQGLVEQAQRQEVTQSDTFDPAEESIGMVESVEEGTLAQEVDVTAGATDRAEQAGTLAVDSDSLAVGDATTPGQDDSLAQQDSQDTSPAEDVITRPMPGQDVDTMPGTDQAQTPDTPLFPRFPATGAPGDPSDPGGPTPTPRIPTPDPDADDAGWGADVSLSSGTGAAYQADQPLAPSWIAEVVSVRETGGATDPGEAALRSVSSGVAGADALPTREILESGGEVDTDIELLGGDPGNVLAFDFGDDDGNDGESWWSL